MAQSDSASNQALLARLRELLARGETLRSAGRAVGRSPWAVYRLANKHALTRRRRSIDEATRAKVKARLAEARLTLSRIAELCGVSVSTVWRIREDRPAGAPRRVRAYRCDGCCLTVNLFPCQICAAMAARRGPSRPSTD